jgi:hypothetical protein
MKASFRKAFWVLGRLLIVLIGIVTVGFGGLVGCVKLIGNSNSCNWANIDNIELRAHIDIPAIEPGSCICILDKEDGNSKTNFFKIRTDAVDMDRYVSRNSFIPVDDTELDLSVFGKLSKIPEITPENSEGYYYNSGYNPGKGKRTHWLAIVDRNSGDLWVYMKYKDRKQENIE